eukprot:7366681-Karenia_brevis.AAC.1
MGWSTKTVSGRLEGCMDSDGKICRLSNATSGGLNQLRRKHPRLPPRQRPDKNEQNIASKP